MVMGVRKKKNMYQAGIYCRISVEEREKEEEWSNSIHSQILMAEDYIAGQCNIIKTKIYADDGVSGSTYNRTEFRRMLADIELGTINMVILKDISRLGRERITTAYYLGRYFPEKEIRVVSILDRYDSAVSIHDELLEIKILLNAAYLGDASKKIRTAIRIKRSMGEYTAKEPPFGYVKSRMVHNHLEVDAYAAEIVVRIYRMYLNGSGGTVISRILNEEQIPAPAKYKKEILKNGYPWKVGKGLWTPDTVRKILKNPIYTGGIMIKKYDRPSCKLNRRKSAPFEEMELIPDVHEAIISKEDFVLAQQIRKNHRISHFDKNKEPHKYAGLLFCGKCKRAMCKRYIGTYRGYDGYECGFHQKMGQKFCELNHITFEKLDELVAFSINQQLKLVKSDINHLKLRISGKKLEAVSRTARLKIKMKRKAEDCKRAYEQFMDDILSKEEYLELKKNYMEEREKYEKELYKQKQEEQKERTALQDAVKWLEHCSCGKITEVQLTKEVLAELIQRIYVYPDQKMEIYFKFSPVNSSPEMGRQKVGEYDVSDGGILPSVKRRWGK